MSWIIRGIICFSLIVVFDLNKQGKVLSQKSDSTEQECGDEKFSCGTSGECTYKAWLCDGEEDCENGADENKTNCALAKCSNKTHFACEHRCIPSAWQCDRQEDCSDGRDERNCSYQNSCPKGELLCKSGKIHCILESWLCDGDKDCPDLSDESNCTKSCSEDQFSCNGGTLCISKNLVCDGSFDCFDRSDEANCTTNSTTCKATHVRCDSGECIPSSYLCDEEADCADGSDESKYLCTKISCTADQWHCLSSEECINITSVCDGKYDCKDQSDERDTLKFSCSGTQCTSHGCSYKCAQTPVGPQCYCQAGYKLKNDTKTCQDIDECKEKVCDHLCVNREGSYKCRCYDGYLSVHHRYCKSDESIPPTLLIAQIKNILNATIDGQQVNVLHGNLKRAVAIDFHYQKKLIFFTDIGTKTISQTTYGSRVIKPILSSGLFVPDGIAVDWIAENIYFAESKGRRIDVVRLDGRFRHALLENLGIPRGIAVDPETMYLFYTDWGSKEPKIGRCSMDGKNCIKLIDSNITWPNAITLDYVNKKVYWADARLDSISVVDYDGANRRVVAGGIGQDPIPHPFAITLYQGFVYVTDWRTEGVYKADLLNNGKVTRVIKDMRRPMDIQLFHASRQNHSENYCSSFGCKHLGLLSKGAPKHCHCACEMGYTLQADGKTCVRFEQFLILATMSEVRGYTFKNETKKDAIVPVMGLGSAVGVDFDVKEQMLYFSDVGSKRIHRVGFDGANMEVLVNESLSNADGLAVDWVGRNLYWTDGTFKTISVSTLDGKHRHTLIKEDIEKPRAIVVHPDTGTMFWSDWGSNAKIEKACMDGSQRAAIVNGSIIGWPNGLAIDYNASKLYWVDARLDVMMSANFDGSGRTIIHVNLSHPFGMDVYNGVVYWGDWIERTLYQASIHNNTVSARKKLLSNVGSLMEIRAYKRELVSDNKHKCSKSNGGCEELCLLRSSGERTCKCKDGFKTSGDGKKCTNTPPVVVRPTCPPTNFLCNNSRCIFQRWVCDGDNDCLDNSDEPDSCSERTCFPNYKKCDNHKCVPESMFCDGDNDCGDNSDERNCSRTCPAAMFSCQDGRCIPKRWQCDGDSDCADGSDEKRCEQPGSKCLGFACASTGFCLPIRDRCNGEYECVDHSDEKDCPTLNCKDGLFKCDDTCLLLVWKCDGDNDCDDGADEKNCTTPLRICPEESFQCTNFLCIPNNLTCNEDDDCGDRSDEMLPTCNNGCGSGLFNCTNKRCINSTLVCDGADDCDDNSDEKSCPCSGEKKFMCKNKNCIEKSWTCDGVDDCGDLSDEKLPECGPTSATCQEGHFACSSMGKCIEVHLLCDGKLDCPGGEDEGPECLYHECQRNNGGCSHNCTSSPQGVLCSCPAGLELDSDNSTCLDVDECLLPWSCSQKCANTEKSYFCFCADGYMKKPDRRSCQANSDVEDVPFILVSNRVSIRKVDLRGKGGQTKYSEIIRGLRNTIGVDFDWMDKRVYWSDVMTDKIQRAMFDGSHIETIVTGGLISAEGIAVDWIGRNLYWLDMRADKIEVSKLNGSYRSVLISNNLDSPRALQVDPRVGYMFWTDWGRSPRIEKATMDGVNRTIIVNTKIGWPNGMTLDYANKRIYWVDAKLHHLEFCDYNGHNRYTVLTGSSKLRHPFSTTLFEDNVFWTDWAGNALRFTNKYPGGNISDLYATSSRLMDLHVVHPVRQPKGKNLCANNKCSHLCVLIPNGHKCLCPIGLKLESGTCKDVDSFLVYSRRFEIKAISLVDDNAERMIPVTGLRNAIGVDFDYDEDRLYWTDVTDDSISRICVNGTGYEKIIKPGSGLRSPDGVAVDWIAKNIYWTDSGADVIGVCRTDGRFHRIVLSKSDHLDQPRGIALYPSKGYLFWTDWGHKSIQRARLDGSQVKVLINTSLNFVNGLAIDYDGNRIYWADAAFDKIEASDFEGQERKLIPVTGLKHPFGISFFNGSVYWSDWVTHSISKADIRSRNQTVIQSRLPGIMDVCVFDKSRQTGNNPCGKNNGGCPELCLWTGEIARCACRRGYTFNPTNKKCEKSLSFLVYTKLNEFFGFSFNPNDQAAYLPFLSVTINCFAADFIYDDGTIYFADDGKNVIGRVNTDGSGLEYVVKNGLDRPHGIAVDWVGRNMYWTDMGTKLIEVSRLNGSQRLPIISTGLDKPRAIVLHPRKGLMFWTDWGREPKIERAYMDGSNRRNLIANNSKLVVWPNGLTIDYKTDQLCWIDGRLGLIGCMSFEGDNIRQLINDVSNIHGYALTTFGDYIYATFSQTNKIIRADKTTGGNITIFRSTKNARRGPSDVFAFVKSKQLPGGACEDANCEQLCLPTGETTYRCACADGQLSNDGKHCRQSSAFVIFAIEGQIRFLYLDPRKSGAPHPPISKPIQQPTLALDFDYEEKLIFFTVLKKSIMSVYINGSGLKETSLPIIPEGISVDWMEKKIYMTDANNDRIRRINYDGSNMTNVISVGLIEPRAIVVMPCESTIYWTDWGVPSIERALLNGLNRRVLVNSSLGWPNGLTIDHVEGKMYWVDARLDRIESALLDGSERRIIVDNLPHPFAITVLGSSIYWTDWVLRKVMKANKLSGGGQVALTETLNVQPMDIQMFTSERQNCTAHPCADNGGCSHKCRPVNGKPVCICRAGYKLLEGFWCVLEASNCSKNQFTCANGQCVTRSYLCDTDDDCADASDEFDVVCAKHTCNPTYSFQCSNGKCIAKRWRCDFDDDCHDNSDEIGCKRSTCLKGHFPCKNGRCISEAFRCDADNDCRDFSDETGCPPVTCASGRKPCSNNSMCIRESWICDGDDDCGDKSDESPARCSNTTCLKSEIKCSGTGRCIPARWQCDGDNDCGDGSDEPSTCKDRASTCKVQDFTCRNGNCISKTFLCDGDNDCGDNSDEKLANCTNRTCSVVEFKCYNASRCIPRTYVCDGDNDCGDASDEHPREGCKHPSCKSGEFRCDNSICIRNPWRCDHENDCGDGSDEHGCSYGTCGPHKFTCANKQCVSAIYKCDDDKDCSDGSDEEGCRSVLKPCKPDEFKCRGSGKCILLSLSCNKIDDCGDNSDEKDCDVDECALDKEHKPCQQICTDSKNGFLCSCRPGYALMNVTKCVDVDECLRYSQNNCSQLCLNTKGSFKCLCGDNYKLASDRRSCKYVGKDHRTPYLLFANRYAILKLSVDLKQFHEVVPDRVNAIAVDYDYKRQRIYWSSSSPKGISSAFFNGTDIKPVINLSRVSRSSPDGLAVDWVEGNLYFCESSEHAIYVSNLNGDYLKRLVSGLKEPRGMAVYPQKGYLYFTDWGKPAIYRVGMDGSDLTILVHNKIGWPNGLTIDYVSKKLFWVDARIDTIEYTDLNGKNKRNILHGKLAHPFAITLFEGQIYWTDWSIKGIHKANKWSGKNHVILYNSTHKPMDIQIVHPLRQPDIPSKCPTKQRDACGGLCLLTPGAAGSGYRCECPDNYYLAPDGKSCLSNCTIDQFSCKNFKCIPELWRCDAEDDCGDRSDEPVSCPKNRTCYAGAFQCQDKNCTSPFYVCDGDNDCPDGSDELMCERRVCSAFKFRCKNHICISKVRKCDGNDDCGDGSDEEGCSRKRACANDEFHCNFSGECVKTDVKCDGVFNCRDGSDEASCPKVSCSSGHFYCSYRCIPNAWVCDKDFDCTDKSDERNCSAPACASDKFSCLDKSCIPKLWRCDHDFDCQDGSDEVNCTFPECKPPNFRCNTSMRCIDKERICNGQNDCRDGSDEENCKSCGQDQYTCGDGYCIQKEWRCDGAVDCKDNSDEIGCQHCASGQFKCNNTLCLDEDVKCDTKNDCGDGSDENDIMCAKHRCSLNEFRCEKRPACIPSFKTCDGEADCPDHSDEPSTCVRHRECILTEFKCLNTSKCVSMTRRCDQRNDCGDGSDEEKCVGSCSIPRLGFCQHRCVDLHPGPGYFCQCRDGYQISSSNSHFCEDVNECLIFGKCSQKCSNDKGSYKCSCFEGYQLSYPSGRPTCRIKDSPPAILIPSNGGIHRFSTNGYGGQRVVSTASKVVCVDFLLTPNSTFLFWLDIKTSTIKMAPVTISRRKKRETDSNRSNNVRTIVTGTGRPISFAVDWKGGNIYSLKSKPGTKTVELSSISGRGNRVLAKLESFAKPKQLILYLEKNKMFWCDAGLVPKIEVANLTGGDRKVLVRSKLYWPTGLAVDPVMDRLFWCDMKENEVETIFTNGTDRRVVLTSAQLRNKFSEPHSIDVFEDYLYIVTRRGVAFKWNKFGFGRPVTLLESLAVGEVGLKIFHKARQSHSSLSKICTPNTCSHICIPNEAGPICLCPDGEINKNKCEKVIDHSCLGYCVHGHCQFRNGKPSCVCDDFAAGEKCELTCKNYNCSGNAECVIKNGERKCLLTCKNYNCSGNGECFIKEGERKCRLTCKNYNCSGNGECFIKEGERKCRCTDNTIQSDCPRVHASKRGSSNTIKLVEIIVPCTFGLLIIIAVCAIFYCRWRGNPSRKFAPFYGSRKASFTYTGMFDEDDDEDGEGEQSRQFVINDSEVNFANPVYNSLFLEGPSRGDYAEVNRQLIFQDDDSRVDFSNPIYDSFYGSNENSELDYFLPKKQSSDVSSGDSFGSRDSLRDSMTRLVKDDPQI